MATSHGRLTVVTVATKDLSTFITTSSYEKKADIHDKTGYGAVAHGKVGGLLEHSFSMSGIYDTTAVTGPRAVLNGAIGTTVAVTRKVEGTSTGKPLDSFNAVIEKYVESNPVDDIVKWSCDMQIDGDIVTTAQP